MRRRQFAQQVYAERLNQPKTPRDAVQRAVALETAIESSLKGGWCPSCGVRIGRNVRAHFETCGGVRE